MVLWQKGGETMKDIPIFPTEFGVASLILSEIPYRQEAYIHVQDGAEETLPQLLRDCASFCRACGAERVLWTGADNADEPIFNLLRMTGTAWVDQTKLENLFPVTEQTVSEWRRIYNERMRSVPQSRTLSFAQEQEVIQSGGAYFVHHEGELLGIGWLEDTHLLAIAATKPGAGERVAHTLMSLVEGAQMTLEVASSNKKAIALYERLGFLTTSVVRSWYEFKWNDK